MPSIKTTATVLATTLFSLGVQAQASYYIDPDSVPLATRQSWCNSQIQACPLLCLQLPGSSSTTAANDCDASTLAFDCVCGNGQSPNASEYSQTLPYFMCTQYGTQCIGGCGGNTQCEYSCRADHPCGAQNPTRINTTSSAMPSTTAGAGASGTNGAVFTGLGGAQSTQAASKKNGSQAVLNLGRSYGLAVVFAGLFAGFAFVM